jgi:hypothetical protein
MKQFKLVFVLAIAALAAAGEMRHASNPLTLAGRKLPMMTNVYPVPACPPACGAHH